MRKALFNLGQTVATRGVWNQMMKSNEFCRELGKAIKRHASGDWGNLCEEDKQMNDEGLKGDERLFSAYDTSQGKIWIITERDRSATTILFPHEY